MARRIVFHYKSFLNKLRAAKVKPTKGTLSADVASHADTPLMHFVTGISFGVTVYRLGIQFANSDWTDRINSFVQNRLVWVGCAKLVVFFHALVSDTT